MNMQTKPSPLERKGTRSRLGELATFATRINRGMKVEVDKDTVIITPSADLGTLRYQELHLEVGRINDLLRHGGSQKLLIDLGERRRLERVILMALVGFCRSIPGPAAFCSVSEEIRQALEGAKLLHLWPIYPDRKEALRAMNSLDYSSLPAGRDT